MNRLISHIPLASRLSFALRRRVLKPALIVEKNMNVQSAGGKVGIANTKMKCAESSTLILESFPRNEHEKCGHTSVERTVHIGVPR